MCLVAVFLVSCWGLYSGWYLYYSWFDIALHFLGGFFMAMFMAGYLKEYLDRGSALKNILIIAGAAMFIGVVWEFAEYIANQVLVEPVYKYFRIRAYFMGNLEDTVTDLSMDALGAITFSMLHLFRRGKTH